MRLPPNMMPRSTPAALAIATTSHLDPKYRWRLAPHLQLLNDLVMELAARRKTRLILTMPPRHGKSSFISHYLSAWWLGNFPHERVILTSYGAELAFRWSAEVRRTINEYGKPLFGVEASGSSNRWTIDGHMGGMLAAGVGGPITGFGANLLIADDLIKNHETAASPTVREATWQWWNSTAYTRIEPGGVAVMIATRWHEDDPIGRILQQMKDDPLSEQWEIFNLPAIAEFDEPPYPLGIGRKKGQALWPERYNERQLQIIERQLGAYWWSALYQQRPTPLGGGMFKESYFNQRCKAAPYHAKRIRYWDRASTEDGGKRTAGVLMAYDGENFYVEHVKAGQWEPDERNRIMRAMALRDRQRYGPKHEPRIYIEREGGSSGRDAWKGVARALAGFPVFEDAVSGDKATRAEPWSAQCAALNVYLVEDGTWDINDYIHEHCAFPNGKFMDQVDASSGPFNIFVGGPQAGTIRVYNLRGFAEKGETRLVIADRESIQNVVFDQPALFVSFTDPEPHSRRMPGHGLVRLLDSIQIEVPDIASEEYQETWEDVIPFFDKKPAELVMSESVGKRLWNFLLKKRDTKPTAIVFQDEGDRRAQSVAYAVCDVMGLKRDKAIFQVGAGADTKYTGPAPNRHIYDMTKKTRRMVIAP